jgi:hypothetical protein
MVGHRPNRPPDRLFGDPDPVPAMRELRDAGRLETLEEVAL